MSLRMASHLFISAVQSWGHRQPHTRSLLLRGVHGESPRSAGRGPQPEPSLGLVVPLSLPDGHITALLQVMTVAKRCRLPSTPYPVLASSFLNRDMDNLESGPVPMSKKRKQ